MARDARRSRAHDQARLADEKAKRVGPQGRRKSKPAKAKPAPEPEPEPEHKYPGATKREREAARSRERRRRAREERERRDGLALSKLRGPGSIAAEVDGDGPPSVEPPLEPGPLTSEGVPVSPLWDMVRGRYGPSTRGLVDQLVARQKLEIDDLVWLELAEHAQLAEARSARGVPSTMLQSRKQIARLLVARGPIGGVNDVPVRVPEGMSLEELTAPLSEGDDVLAQPRDDEFPERLR